MCSLFYPINQPTHPPTLSIQMWSLFYPINFTLVPRAFRPLANNLMGLLFLIVLSVCAYGGGGVAV